MTQKEKAAIMRITSDLIKADSTIDLRELETLDTLRHKYGINQNDEVAATEMTLADAAMVLKGASQSLIADLMGDFSKLSMSDMRMSREEAILGLALRTAIASDNINANILSTNAKEEFNVDFSQVLYVEGEYYSMINQEVWDNFRQITNEFKLIGLNFVYLPKLGEHYQNLPSSQLSTLISFLYPPTSGNHMDNVIRQVTTITTSDFCNDQLVERMNLKGLYETLPSLLFVINRSSVNQEPYINFLQIVIETDLLPVIKGIVDAFSSYYTNRLLPQVCEGKSKFVYRGYYKQALDNIVFRHGIRSSVVVDSWNEAIVLPEVEIEVKGLHRREKALYTLFLMESASGGINFKKPSTMKALATYNRRMQRVQQKYELIYEKFGGERGKAPDITLSENRLPMMSVIKRAFRKIGDTLNQPDNYLVQRNLFGNYCVLLPPELCLCRDNNSDTTHRFKDSSVWSRILAL